MAKENKQPQREEKCACGVTVKVSGYVCKVYVCDKCNPRSIKVYCAFCEKTGTLKQKKLKGGERCPNCGLRGRLSTDIPAPKPQEKK